MPRAGSCRNDLGGIAVSAKVVRTALRHAASMAGLLITTEATVAEMPKDKPAMPMGGGGPKRSKIWKRLPCRALTIAVKLICTTPWLK